jgi:SAM-dependent methyltransferase
MLQVEERHFGSGERFAYEHCRACGSLQIAELPSDTSAHYPAGYYSLQSHWRTRMASPWRRLLKRLRDAYELSGQGLLGRWLASRRGYPELASLRSLGLPKSARILDVGCGDGFLLWSLANLGFTDLTGVDPHLNADSQVPGGPRLLKRSLDDLDGSFDLVMFHHSLEHVQDPARALARAAACLLPGGRCLVRVPTPDSRAFELYREFWIQIDAPRHLHLMSRQALKRLGEVAGLRLASAWDDSNAFQFWASEQARDGISLESPESWDKQGRGRFSPRQMADWSAEARALNAQGRGDSIAFVFEKAP